MNSKKEIQMEMKILIIVIHGPYEPWISIYKNGQLPTWMRNSRNIQVQNYFGKRISPKFVALDQKLYFLRWNKFKIVSYSCLLLEAVLKRLTFLHKLDPRVKRRIDEELGEIWEVNLPDSLLLQGVKNLSAFRNALNFEFDYLVTTISSSYINYSALYNCLNNSPREKFLGGRIEKSGVDNYQQGSLRAYSRDVVVNLVENRRKYNHWQIEDIAMGNLARKSYASFTEIKNMTVSSVEEAKALTSESLKSFCSIRCKSVLDDGRRADVEIMRTIHELLQTS